MAGVAERAARREIQRSRSLWFVPAAAAALLFLLHLPYFGLPYFWDELGQFVPAALDLYQDGSLVPHSAVPNAHPPGVMAYLALTWRVFGYSIPLTRGAMLLLAAFGAAVTFFLARELCRSQPAAPYIAVVFLLADPLFYTQAMMAQLDMPAMLFTIAGLLLFFEGRHTLAALASTALVLTKETGVLLPAIFILALLAESARRKQVLYYLAPFIVLLAWFFLLWRATGHVFGDPGFTHYNIGYALHPVRAALSFIRRIYYLFIADFRWIGSLAILFAWRTTSVFDTPKWKIAGSFAAAHILLVSVLGGAELERYLMPVIPLFYIAAAAAFITVRRPLWRAAAAPAMLAGLIAGLFVNPPFPFPFENNLAMTDFVELHHRAAQFLEQANGKQSIYTAWPLTAALRNPAFGYVRRPLQTIETSDLRYSTLAAIDPAKVDVLVLYSRTWEPAWGVMRWSPVQAFLNRFYEYERQMDAAGVRAHFGLSIIRRWEQRGQWIEIYGRFPTNSVLSLR